jgi:hypothetical protein
MLAAGCVDTSTQPRDTTETEQVGESAAASESRRDDSPRQDAGIESSRQSVGPISFAPPPGWEVKQASGAPGLSMFAPDRPAWEKIGFRANLGVLRRPHPGVSLEQHREQLDELLTQSTERLNETIGQYARAEHGGAVPEVLFKEKPKYSLDVSRIDGVRALTTTCTGAFELPQGVVATKTYGIQILRDDALYSIALTFPREFEGEMDAAWKSFTESVRIAE